MAPSQQWALLTQVKWLGRESPKSPKSRAGKEVPGGLRQGPSSIPSRGYVCACLSQGLLLLVGFLAAMNMRTCVI